MAFAPSDRQLNALEPWKSGLLGCFSDPGSCCLTCCCPCITFGRIVRIVDKGSASCCGSGALYALRALGPGFLCFYSYVYRAKMRQQFSLEESPCDDCLVHCFCEQCALCQEYRELKSRGFNMAIGWRENIARNPEVPMGMSTLGPGIDPPKVDDPPEVDEEMSRDS